MEQPRDFQRKRLYRAEQAVREFSVQSDKNEGWIEFMNVEMFLQRELWFRSTDDIEEYLRRVMRTKWYKRVCPKSYVTQQIAVETHGAHFHAHYYYDGTMKFPPWPKPGITNELHRELVVLHELAHHVTPLRYAGHGAEFSGNFLYIVTNKLGPEYGALLTSAYAAHKVVYRPAKLRKDI